MRPPSDFDKLWFGQTVSQLGSALTLFALPTVAILLLHATPFQVGVLGALEALAFPTLGLFAGVIADRISRRRIMIVADVTSFAALAIVPIAAAVGALNMLVLYGIALVMGITAAFFGIAYQSYLPVIVPMDRLSDANTKLEISNSGSGIAGSALAGVLVQWIGAAATIAFDAVSYLVSVVAMLAIRTPEPAHEGRALSPRQLGRELLEGIPNVFRSDLRWILGATATCNLGGSMIAAVFFVYAYRVLYLQPGPLGIVYGLAELGFVGALFSTRICDRLGLRATMILALAALACATASMLLAQIGLPYVVLFLTAAISAIVTPIYNINQVTYRQTLVDVRQQGKMNATMRTFVSGTASIGALVGGAIGSLAGVTTAIAIGAVLCGASAAWLLPLRKRDAGEALDATTA